MSHALLSLVLLAALPSPAFTADDERRVESHIASVTVFSGTASVLRRAVAPAGDARIVLPGLPHGLDPDSVRVRCEGGEVVGVEIRERVETAASDGRLAGLRGELRELRRALAVVQDERSVLKSMEEHVLRLLRLEERAQGDDVRAGRTDPAAWDANFEYLAGKLSTLRTELREVGWRVEEQELAIRNLELDLGRVEAGAGIRVRDVLVDLVDTSGEEGVLEVEYLVGNAGWSPDYDLRAEKTLARVDLVYRAKVWQRSGEDWGDVELVLSTAQPQRGTRGPEPPTRWLSLHDPRQRDRAEASRALRGLGYAGEDATAESPGSDLGLAAQDTFARVSDEGLSLRYRLPRPETIESRDQPSTVLIGRESMPIEPEHYCVPAVDTTVWLRGKAKNTSPWVLLPGRVAVYFGADFLGHADFDAVQRGEEFTLHLGPDPGMVVKRTQLKDMTEGSGIFSSRETLNETWRIDVENHGGFSPETDGSVLLIVHESLPKPTDDRITVDIAKVTPALQGGARWKEIREEKNVLTWVLRVPLHGKQRIELTTKIVYPEKMVLIRR